MIVFKLCYDIIREAIALHITCCWLFSLNMLPILLSMICQPSVHDLFIDCVISMPPNLSISDIALISLGYKSAGAYIDLLKITGRSALYSKDVGNVVHIKIKIGAK